MPSPLVRGSPYASVAWRKLRKLVLERDGYRCQIRGPRCKGRATEGDHIVRPDDGGGFLDPQNVRAACRPCNGSRFNNYGKVTKPSREW